MADIVRPALADGTMNKNADRLREALAAALADDRHENLDRVLGGTPESPEIPNLKVASHA